MKCMWYQTKEIIGKLFYIVIYVQTERNLSKTAWKTVFGLYGIKTNVSMRFHVSVCLLYIYSRIRKRRKKKYKWDCTHWRIGVSLNKIKYPRKWLIFWIMSHSKIFNFISFFHCFTLLQHEHNLPLDWKEGFSSRLSFPSAHKTAIFNLSPSHFVCVKCFCCKDCWWTCARMTYSHPCARTHALTHIGRVKEKTRVREWERGRRKWDSISVWERERGRDKERREGERE